MASVDETYELITRNLQEVLGGDIIKSVLAEGRTVKCYWGKVFGRCYTTHERISNVHGWHQELRLPVVVSRCIHVALRCD